jgi:hypothetical protein
VKAGGTAASAGWRVDRRTFLKALGLGGIGLFVGGALGSRLSPLVLPAAAQTTPIDDLALQLQFDPERIFRFVADEIRYQPYAGLLRGPEGTLMARAGNSVDQAALLAALLRASGMEVRFATGPLEGATVTSMLQAATMDASTLRRELAVALTGTGDGGRPLGTVELDPASRELLDEARRTSDSVVAWARDAVLETSTIIETALADAGIALPAAATGLPGSEVDGHVWVQAAAGPVWRDLDPSLPGALPGEVGSEAPTVHAELPDSLRHRLTFRVISEISVGGALSEETVLDADEFADVLAGRPIGILNVEQESLKALGASITSGLEGGTVYLPCLVLGEDVVVGQGQMRFGGASAADPLGDVAAATPGIADGEATAEWVEIAIASPDRPPVVVRRAVFDRLGPAVRTQDPPDLSTLGPADLVELDPSGPPDFVPAQRTHWLTVHTGIIGGEPLMGHLREPGPINSMTAQVDAYHVVREAAGLETLVPLGVTTFIDGPDITSLTVDQELGPDGSLLLRPVLDIWHRSLGTLPVADVAAAITAPAVAAGVLPHVAERLCFGAGVDGEERMAQASVGAVFDAARRSGVGFRAVQAPDDLADLEMPPDALARLSASLRAGMVAIVPERPVEIDGQARSGWWLVDPATGRTRDEADDGRGMSMVERGAITEADAEALPPLRRMGNCAAMVAFIAAPIIVGAALSTSDDPVTSWGGAALAIAAIANQAAKQWGLPPSELPPGMFGC